APYNTYLSKDNRPITLGALEPKFWLAFCAGAGIEPSVEAFLPGPHQAALKRRVGEVFASKTREEWVKISAELDCCIEPMLTPAEAASDPHLASRGVFFRMQTPRGEIPQWRTPVTSRDTAFSPPPGPGEHTRAILRESGLRDDEIDALLKAGVAKE